MNTTTTIRSSVPARSSTATLITAALVLLATGSQEFLPRGKVLFELPPWVTPTASGLAIVASLALLSPLTRNRQALPAVAALSGVGLLMLLWSAGGVLLDVVMLLNWLFVPRFFSPDWPSAAARTLSLITAILLFNAAVHHRRHIRDECLQCGRGPGTLPIRQRRWLGYAGLVLGLPYPLIKTHWALGGTIGLDYPDLARDGFTSGWLVVPAALIGWVLSLALVHRWGRLWPRWVPFLAGRPTPRGLLLFGGWFGTSLLLTMGLIGTMDVLGLMAGKPAQATGGMHEWPAAVFYVSWLLWGLVLAPATRLYQLRTKGRCAACDSQPELERRQLPVEAG